MSGPSPRSNLALVLGLIVVAVIAVGVIAWAAMPLFGPMPGMGH
jgi:hypothetical protein